MGLCYRMGAHSQTCCALWRNVRKCELYSATKICGSFRREHFNNPVYVLERITRDFVSQLTECFRRP